MGYLRRISPWSLAPHYHRFGRGRSPKTFSEIRGYGVHKLFSKLYSDPLTPPGRTRPLSGGWRWGWSRKLFLRSEGPDPGRNFFSKLYSDLLHLLDSIFTERWQISNRTQNPTRLRIRRPTSKAERAALYRVISIPRRGKKRSSDASSRQLISQATSWKQILHALLLPSSGISSPNILRWRRERALDDGAPRSSLIWLSE